MHVMIVSFADPATERFFRGGVPPSEWQSVAAVGRRKLDMLDAATTLDDLRSPPGNRLENLNDDRKGQRSIRINLRWRICFRWTDNGPESVEIVDYH